MPTLKEKLTTTIKKISSIVYPIENKINENYLRNLPKINYSDINEAMHEIPFSKI